MRKGHMVVIRICCIFLVFFCTLNKSVMAESACQNEVYGVSAIQIDETASTANEAQINSMRRAHRAAFNIVINRLLIDDLPQTVDVMPESLVELVHIRTETSLPGRYIAEIDICFSPELMRDLFREQNLSWAEVNSPVILVLPVFVDGAGARAWQKTNLWLNGWLQEASSASGLLQYAVLKPTLQNERQLRAEKIAIADEDVLKNAAKRAKAEQILWTRAVVGIEDDVPVISMQAIIFDAEGAVIANVMDETDYQDKKSRATLFETFRTTVLERLETGWQKANIRQDGDDNTLVVFVRFSKHEEWVEKQDKLNQLSAINGFDTKLITTIQDETGQKIGAQAMVMMNMNGSLEALGYGLPPLGLRLTFENGVPVIE